MLVPIGSWCRTAYQVNEFLKTNGIQSVTYPFDWTVTPFTALKLTLDKHFKPSDVLQNDNLRLSLFGSLLDVKTQLIHHHDLPPTIVKRFEYVDGKQSINKHRVPFELFKSTEIGKAKGRFEYGFSNFKLLKSHNKKIGFVRWIRSGHPDAGLPDAFEGESISSLATIINCFLGHDNFSILQVKSHLAQKENNCNNIISSYEIQKYGVAATILERKGFNGDGTENFRGDTPSWHKLLSKYVDDQEIDL